MHDIQLSLDRVEIEALRAEFTDAAMMNDHRRLVALFVPDGAIRIPDGSRRCGASHLNYAIYHDRYRRTPDGWRFAERTYEIRYLDDSPLAGNAPDRPASTFAGQDT